MEQELSTVMVMYGTPLSASKQSLRIIRADHTPLRSMDSTTRRLPGLTFKGARCGEFLVAYENKEYPARR